MPPEAPCTCSCGQRPRGYAISASAEDEPTHMYAVVVNVRRVLICFITILMTKSGVSPEDSLLYFLTLL